MGSIWFYVFFWHVSPIYGSNVIRMIPWELGTSTGFLWDPGWEGKKNDVYVYQDGYTRCILSFYIKKYVYIYVYIYATYTLPETHLAPENLMVKKMKAFPFGGKLGLSSGACLIVSGRMVSLPGVTWHHWCQWVACGYWLAPALVIKRNTHTHK